MKVNVYRENHNYNTKITPIFKEADTETEYLVELMMGVRCVGTIVASDKENYALKRSIEKCPSALIQRFEIRKETVVADVLACNNEYTVRFLLAESRADLYVIEKQLQKICDDICGEIGGKLKIFSTAVIDVLTEEFEKHNFHLYTYFKNKSED